MIKLTSYSEQGLAKFLQSHKETQLTIKVNLQSHQDISYLKIMEDQLSQLIHLTELSIEIPRYCVLSQRGYTHIANAIKHLTQLTKLSIQIKGFIQNEELVLLQNSISNLTHLQTLIFKVYLDNDISSSTGQEFVDSLQSLSYLRKLTLQFIGIQKSQINEGNIHFWRGIQQLQNLEMLALEFQEFKYGWMDLVELFSHIIELKKLKHFSLILIGEHPPAFIVDTIISYVGQMINLQSLKICFDSYQDVILNDIQILDLMKNLRNLKQLENLKIKEFSKQIMKHHLEQYADLIGSLKYLKKLNLDCSNISQGKSLNWLGQSFLNLTNITSFELNLQETQVYNEFISDLSVSLNSMKNLRILKLFLCDLNNHQSIEIGNSLSQLDNLTTMFLDMKSMINGQAGSLLLNSLDGTISINEFILRISTKFYYSSFYENLHKLVNLETLEIPTINLCNDERLELLGQTFRNLKQLKELSISLLITYQMNQESVSMLESTFIELQSLESLNIELGIDRNNQAITKINLLQHLKNLKKLNAIFQKKFLNVFDLSLSSITKEYTLEEAKVSSAYSFKSEIFLEMMDSLSSNFPKINKLSLNVGLADCSIEFSKQFSTICTQFTNLQTLILKDIKSSISFYLKGIKKLKTLKKLVLISRTRIIEEEEKLGKTLQKLVNLRKFRSTIDLNQIKDANLEKQYCRLLQNHQKLTSIKYNSVCIKLNNTVSFNEKLNEKEEDILSNDQNEISFGEQKRVTQKEEDILQATQYEMSFSEQKIVEYKQIIQEKVVSKKFQLLPNELKIDIINEGEQYEEQLSTLSNCDNIDLQYLVNLEIKSSKGISQYKFPVNGFTIQLNQLHSLRYLNINLQNLVLSEEQTSQFSYNSSNLKHLINLRSLIIKIGQINDHYCALLDQFKCFKDLLTFKLVTTISKGAAIVLGNSLIELTNLEDCALDLCYQNKLGLFSILNGLKGKTNMQKLNVHCYTEEDESKGEVDDCDDDGTELVSDFFVGMSKLYSFVFDWRVSDNVKIKVPQLYSSLSQSPYLQKLSIKLSEFNSFNQQMLNQLINSLNKLSHLISVQIEIYLLSSDNNSSNNFSIAKSLSDYLNKQFDIPLIINYDIDSIELVQRNNFSFKINSNLIGSLELDFLEELNEKKVIEFNLGQSKILTILHQIKRCVTYKLRLKQLRILETKDADDVCDFISEIPNISMLQMNLIINESIMDDSLTQIASQILQMKNLQKLCLIIIKNIKNDNDNDNNLQECTEENLLILMSKIVKLQKLQELYLLTENYYVSIPIQKRIKKKMKKLVKYEVNLQFRIDEEFNI